MLLIKNAVLNGEKKDIMLIGNRISKIADKIKSEANIREIDAKGGTVLSGFIDLHTHLREPGFEYKEDIKSGLSAAVAGGFTAVSPMPNTNPTQDNKYIIDYVMHRAEEVGLARLYPIGAITKGLQSNELSPMAEMKKSGIFAVSDDGAPVSTANMMKLGMEYAKGLDLLVISHCEDKSLADGCANEGVNATKAGLRGISRVSEEMMVAREILLSDATGARVHIAHVSTRNSVDLIRWGKAKGIKVTAETCPHYIVATDELILDYDANAKVNPPLRTEDDRQAIIEGLLDGTIDCISTDHAPHHISEKDIEFDKAANGISGLESAFALCYTALVKSGLMTLGRLSTLMSENPSKIGGILKGELKEDGLADIVIVDIDNEYEIDSTKWFSKGKNTPFNGYKVYGKVLATVVNGKLVYEGGLN